jgi:hypothetical protein
LPLTPSRSGALTRAATGCGSGQNETKTHGPGRGFCCVLNATRARPAERPARRPWHALLLLSAGLSALPSGFAGATPEVPERIDFNRDVRQILSNTCLKCHGPDAKGNPSGLRLDQPEFAHAPHKDKSGRVTIALVPGKPEASEVWRRITSSDPAVVMPPRDALHQLSVHGQGGLPALDRTGRRLPAALGLPASGQSRTTPDPARSGLLQCRHASGGSFSRRDPRPAGPGFLPGSRIGARCCAG